MELELHPAGVKAGTGGCLSKQLKKLHNINEAMVAKPDYTKIVKLDLIQHESPRENRYIAESSDTESADVRPKETKLRLPTIQLTSTFFKKKQDKVASEEEPDALHVDTDEADADTITAEDQENAAEGKPKLTEVQKTSNEKDKGLVYAELDLLRANSPTLKPVVVNDDEKTEYAEIVYTPAQNEEEKDKKDSQAKEKK